MGRGFYWFAKDASWAITNEITKKGRKSGNSNYSKTSSDSILSEEKTNELFTVHYKPERKKILICSCLSLISAICGLLFLHFEVMWPFFCVLVWGFISWVMSMFIISNTDHGTTIKHIIPDGEEKYQKKLHRIRFFGCLPTFVISLLYIIIAMQKGSILTSILGVVALIAIGYPFVCSVEDL